MRSFTSLGCILLALPLLACGTRSDGYYDSHGNWIASSQAAHAHPLVREYNTPHAVTPYYERPGYYDYHGLYVDVYDGTPVPPGMFPQRGMCRVWFPDRVPANQPPIESCDGIRLRVPDGAYVIYGG